MFFIQSPISWEQPNALNLGHQFDDIIIDQTPQSTPEPTSLIGLLLVGASALGLRRQG